MAKNGFALEEGELLVRAARRSIEYAMASGRVMRESAPKSAFTEERGVFVTLHTFPARELRGCIGYPEPVRPLWNAVLECAVNAAFNDPRFPQLRAGEMDNVVVEVSVLTRPEPVVLDDETKPEQYLKKINVGRDGLIAERGAKRGLLLPQVAPERGWKEGEFLSQTCRKAGLSTEAWKEKGTKIYSFQAQVFGETKPKGKVVEGEQGKVC
ncbi:MAG: TIGR00296 family protein [Candidatus Diapherotrites archaeon]